MGLYSIFDYGSMIADRVRMDAYVQALRKHITPQSVVLDIGTGTGIFALLACQMGARRVYAIEPDDSIQIAKDLAAANGYAKRIEFYQSLSTAVAVPEPADVMVSDLGGLLPWFQHHIPSIIDARQRLLKPRGTIIPQHDRAWAVIVEAPEFYARYTDGWDRQRFGLDMNAAQITALNTLRRFRATPDQLLAPPQCWAELNYATVRDANVKAEIQFTIERPGTAHGLCLWFDRRLAQGIEIVNAPAPAATPGQAPPTSIYAPLFFPLGQAVALRAGDSVDITLGAHLVGDDYVWRWDTRVFDTNDRSHCQVDLRQSTFRSIALSPASLRKRASTYRPVMSQEGEIDIFVLRQVIKNLTLAEIAANLQEQYPHRFTAWHDALTRVSDLVQRYNL